MESFDISGVAYILLTGLLAIITYYVKVTHPKMVETFSATVREMAMKSEERWRQAEANATADREAFMAALDKRDERQEADAREWRAALEKFGDRCEDVRHAATSGTIAPLSRDDPSHQA